MEIKLISRDDILSSNCTNMDEIIACIEDVFRARENGNVMLPDKISQVFDYETQNRINCMPATLYDKKVCGVKWVSVFPENPAVYGIPNVSGLIILSEIEKGYPLAVMDGTLLTAVRTACMGAIGAKYLARKDSKVYAAIGAGEQAKMHFKAIKRVIPTIVKCRVASRTEEREKQFIEELRSEYPDVEFVSCKSDYSKCAKGADVIVTALSCQKPILKANDVDAGTYYCHVGGWEDEYNVAKKSNKIVCDDWEQLKHRGSPTIARMHKEGLLSDGDIYCNLGELIMNQKPGRENQNEITYFNSIGLAFVDVAVAHMFYKKVLENNRGTNWTC